MTTACGTVARGRTVRIVNIEYHPGAEVTLPAGEIAWLRELGFLVDPDKIAPNEDHNMMTSEDRALVRG
jgi:hypothetical protein